MKLFFRKKGDFKLELIYIWINRFRNFENESINLGNKFTVEYMEREKKIKILKNNGVASLYPSYIKNINAIIGKNGVGKTNVLDLIGLRINDRNRVDEEYQIHYELEKELGLEVQTGYTSGFSYFLIYYDEEKDLFYFEGNHKTQYSHLFCNPDDLKNDNFEEKVWFLYECEYRSDLGKFKVHQCNQAVHKRNHLGIINLREFFNKRYYTNDSFDSKDENKVSIPRRVGGFQSKHIYKQIEMLFNYMKIDDRLIFHDEQYKLIIPFNSHFFKMKGLEDRYYDLPYSCSECEDVQEKDKCRVIESFIYCYYFHSKYNGKKDEVMDNIDKDLSKIKLEIDSLEGYSRYYKDIFEKIVNTIKFPYQDMRDYSITAFNNFVDVIMSSDLLIVQESSIELVIHKEADIDGLVNIIKCTIDEPLTSEETSNPSIFDVFFKDYRIDSMSDGEKAYLGFYSALFEQLDLFTNKKEKYIILLDEPESRFHPELSRNFINELIKFLEPIRDKSFQLIISSHSPFILSDILTENVIYVKKENNQRSTIRKSLIQTFGGNIHKLLKDGFFMEATLGEYAVSKINDIIKLIEDKTNSTLSEDEYNRYLAIIDCIGEPLIANQLRKKFTAKFNKIENNQVDYRKELDKYKNLLKEMENFINEEKRHEWDKKKGELDAKN